MKNTEETQDTEETQIEIRNLRELKETQKEIEKERYEQYLAQEKNIFDSLLSNNVELNRTMRYFSGAILVLMTAYIDWKTVNNAKYMLYSYAPFVLSIIFNIISFIFIRSSLHKQSEFNADYYLRNIEEARTQRSISHIVGGILVYLSILLFILGILVFSGFLAYGRLNLKGG